MPSIVLQSPGPILFQIGGLSVRWYGIMIALGFLLAAFAATRLAQRNDLDEDKFLNCCLLSFIGGILGARLYYVALNLSTFASHPDQILATWLGGLSIHGGIIGGLITGWLYSQYAKLSFTKGCDIIATVLPLGQAIGRWGNFFNNEAFGKPVGTDFPLKLYIPSNMRPLPYETNNFFHPTFLYESVFDLALFILLYFALFDRLKKYPGLTFFTYLGLYSVGRFMIEPLRTDSIMIGSFAAPYVVSLALIIFSILAACYILIRSKQQKS